MFSEKFSPLIKAFPREADSLKRISAHFDQLEEQLGDRISEVELSIGRLFDISEAGSSASFAKVTTILLDAAIFEKRYIIRSPLGPEILEVPSWYDCPLEVYDPLRDVMMEVDDSQLETVYSVPSNGL